MAIDKLLIVEDKPEFLENARRGLENQGINIYTAYSLENAEPLFNVLKRAGNSGLITDLYYSGGFENPRIEECRQLYEEIREFHQMNQEAREIMKIRLDSLPEPEPDSDYGPLGVLIAKEASEAGMPYTIITDPGHARNVIPVLVTKGFLDKEELYQMFRQWTADIKEEGGYERKGKDPLVSVNGNVHFSSCVKRPEEWLAAYKRIASRL